MTYQNLKSANRQPGGMDLIDELVKRAAKRAHELLSAPEGAARLRQIGADGRSEIERLEASAAAVDQIVSVALRLGGAKASPGGLFERLSTHFETPAASLEVEAERRNIWRADGCDPGPNEDAEVAVAILERGLSGLEDLELSERLSQWAALYADLWCDPRLGATSQARRVMLAMVSLLHERSTALNEGGISIGGRS